MNTYNYIKYLNETSSRFTNNKIYKIQDDDYNYYIISDDNRKIIIHTDIIKRNHKGINWIGCTEIEYDIQLRKIKLKTLNNL